jgi:hypothetical protein
MYTPELLTAAPAQLSVAEVPNWRVQAAVPAASYFRTKQSVWPTGVPIEPPVSPMT